LLGGSVNIGLKVEETCQYNQRQKKLTSGMHHWWIGEWKWGSHVLGSNLAPVGNAKRVSASSW
jgi:hypothetical protein